MSLLKLKEQFIDKLTRFKNGTDFMDSDKPIEAKEKWESELVRLREELNDLEYQLRQSGCAMSDEEIHRLIENL
jgi:chromosome condensin MukBEF ATPase and DNA-binding subunit MukB